MVFDPVWRTIGVVREDFDRLQRSLGVTPYRWRVHFLGTGEIAERERAFGSPERAFYNLRDYVMSRVQQGINQTSDLVTIQIQNIETGEMVGTWRGGSSGRGLSTPSGTWWPSCWDMKSDSGQPPT